MDFDGCVNEFIEQLDKLITKWAKKEKVNKKIFSIWKNRVLQIFNARIQKLKVKCNNYKYPKFFDPLTVKYLNNLHKDYVVTIADKASSNFVFICKHYYLNVLCSELNFFNNSNSTTYKVTNNFEHATVNRNLKDLLIPTTSNKITITESLPLCIVSLNFIKIRISPDLLHQLKIVVTHYFLSLLLKV